jgi:hypothetical protein
LVLIVAYMLTPRSSRHNVAAAWATQEILERVLDQLPVTDIGRTGCVCHQASSVVKGCRPAILRQRSFSAHWSWQKANAVERAAFFDLFAHASCELGYDKKWEPGPNSANGMGMNRLEEESGTGSEPWLGLSGGTDWQGFQGGFRCVAKNGLRPTWVSFRVQVMTPEFSGAFFTLAAGLHTWGLADPIVSFHYNGDERPKLGRCFVVQSGSSQKGDALHSCLQKPEANRPYNVAIRLDWLQQEMSVFIDGALCLEDVAFKASLPIRYAAVYNWRSNARAAFSEILLGDYCPHEVQQVSSIVKSAESNVRWDAGIVYENAVHCLCVCKRRKLVVGRAKEGILASTWRRPMALTLARPTVLFASAAVTVCLVAMCVQLFLREVL